MNFLIKNKIETIIFRKIKIANYKLYTNILNHSIFCYKTSSTPIDHVITSV
jgi:hypothetical protein